MKNELNTTEIRFGIAERFLQVIEMLIEDRRAHNYRDVERLTGIEHQRINAIKSYVTKGSRPAYPNIEYFYSLQKAFDISIDYIVSGQGDMFRSNASKLDSNRSRQEGLDPDKKANQPESILEMIRGIKVDVEHIKKFF